MSYLKGYKRKSAPVQYEYTGGVINTDGNKTINANLSCSGYNRVGLYFESMTGYDIESISITIVPKPSSSITGTHQTRSFSAGMDTGLHFNNAKIDTGGFFGNNYNFPLNGFDYIDVFASTASTTSLTSIKYWVVFYNE